MEGASRPPAWWLLVAWMPAVAGLAWLAAQDGGVSPTVPPPAGGSVARAAEQPVHIDVCVHPSCPCTSRTLDLLADLVDARPGIEVTLLMTVPRKEASPSLPFADDDPSRGGRFSLEVDPGGERARALGAERSGHALVTDPQGRVVFSGGVVHGGAHHRRTPQGVASMLETVDRLLASADAVAMEPVDGCRLVLEREESR